MEQASSHRWARVPPSLAWKRPGLPKDWVPVLEHHPDGFLALPGFVWLDVPGKVRHVEERDLEFRCSDTRAISRPPASP